MTTRTRSSYEPLVSIIIPCYNCEDYVVEAIDSVLSQTYSNCEIIVVDDGSTDGSLEVLGGFGRDIRLESGINRGGCAARNRGIDLARGEYIKFLDADDALYHDAITTQVDLSSRIPADTICYGRVVDYETHQLVLDHRPPVQSFDREEMVRFCVLNEILTSCPLHRSVLLKGNTRFDEGLERGQEWNFHIRLAANGVRFMKHNDLVYKYRNHASKTRVSTLDLTPNSGTANAERFMRTFSYLEKTFTPLPPLLKQAIHTKVYTAARNYAASQNLPAAEELFAFARTMQPDQISLKLKFHQLLTQVLGILGAESLIRTGRSLRDCVVRGYKSLRTT